MDTIREITNIGMGNAATALSQMIDRPVEITVPQATITDVNNVAQLLGGEEQAVAATYVQVVGDVRGHLVLVFSIEDAHSLIKLIAPGAKLDLMQDEMARSAVQELGNILSSSFLRSLMEMTQLNMQPTVPAVAVDFAGSIVSSVVCNLYEVSEKLVVVQTNFVVSGEEISGFFIFIPEPGSLSVILQSLGVGG
ncbi:chemotaxis protein CheC [bacterium]|nr:chemotaxis protein CheC [bacterium]